MQNKHSRYETIILMILLCAGGASATYTIDFNIYNINNLQPLQGVNITYNISADSTATDSLGAATLTLPADMDVYPIRYTLSGYHTTNINYTWTGSTVESVAMYPISTDGLVFIRIRDHTLNNRETCILYGGSQRIQGCYQANETIKLLVNQEYVFVPEIHHLDMVSSRRGLEQYFTLLATITGGFIILAFLVGLIVYVGYSIVRKK